jgi:hypothetical protein
MARRKKVEAPNPLPRTDPAVERAFAAVMQLSPEEQQALWVRLFEANAPITAPYREQTTYLQERACRAESRPPRDKRLLTEDDKQILHDKKTLSWPGMIAKHGLPGEAPRKALNRLRQMHRRAQQCLSENYVETEPGVYQPVGHGERVYSMWEAVLIQLARDKR